MRTIKRYIKAQDAFATYRLREPDYAEDDLRIVDLCELEDGYTYVAVPDGLTLPGQPEQITVEDVTLTAELAAEIKAVSKHVRLINDRVVAKVRERYQITDEIKMLRLAPSPESDVYNDYVEECRQWGFEEKAALGFLPF